MSAAPLVDTANAAPAPVQRMKAYPPRPAAASPQTHPGPSLAPFAPIVPAGRAGADPSANATDGAADPAAVVAVASAPEGAPGGAAVAAAPAPAAAGTAAAGAPAGATWPPDTVPVSAPPPDSSDVAASGGGGGAAGGMGGGGPDLTALPAPAAAPSESDSGDAVDGGAGGPLAWTRAARPGDRGAAGAGGRAAPALWSAAFTSCSAPCYGAAERTVLCRDARGLPLPPSACGEAAAGAPFAGPLSCHLASLLRTVVQLSAACAGLCAVLGCERAQRRSWQRRVQLWVGMGAA